VDGSVSGLLCSVLCMTWESTVFSSKYSEQNLQIVLRRFAVGRRAGSPPAGWICVRFDIGEFPLLLNSVAADEGVT
jgi:hypothetical protein